MKILKHIFNATLYILTWTFGSLLGWLPDFVWRLLADILYLFLYKIAHYRVRVTRENLKKSFPLKSDKELRSIERRFYLYLMDIFIETIVMVGISRFRINMRMKFSGNEEFDAVCAEQSVIVAMAHYASWEWPTIYAGRTKSTLIPVYHTLASEWADKLFLRMRSRFGAKPISMRLVGRKLVEMRNEKIILALIADQTPPALPDLKWIPFLNQETLFFNGIEDLSLKYKMPVYFFDIQCVRRGFYKGEFVKLYDGTESVERFEITNRYIKHLEHKIVEAPQFWMWSHKRWKHDKAYYENKYRNTGL